MARELLHWYESVPWYLVPIWLFDVGATILSAVKAPGLGSGDAGCGEAAALVGAQSRRADPAKMNKNFIIVFHGSGMRVPASGLGGGREHVLGENSLVGGNSLVGVAGCLPMERQPPGLLHRVQEITSMDTGFIRFPAAIAAARWVVGGTGISALLPPAASFQPAENCHRAGSSPSKVRR